MFKVINIGGGKGGGQDIDLSLFKSAAFVEVGDSDTQIPTNSILNSKLVDINNDINSFKNEITQSTTMSSNDMLQRITNINNQLEDIQETIVNLTPDPGGDGQDPIDLTVINESIQIINNSLTELTEYVSNIPITESGKIVSNRFYFNVKQGDVIIANHATDPTFDRQLKNISFERSNLNSLRFNANGTPVQFSNNIKPSTDFTVGQKISLTPVNGHYTKQQKLLELTLPHVETGFDSVITEPDNTSIRGLVKLNNYEYAVLDGADKKKILDDRLNSVSVENLFSTDINLNVTYSDLILQNTPMLNGNNSICKSPDGLFIFGGLINGTLSNKLFFTNSNTDETIEILLNDSPITPREGASLFFDTANNLLYLAGGNAGTTFFAEIYTINTSTGTVTQINFTPDVLTSKTLEPFSNTSLSKNNNKLLIIGGNTQNEDISGFFELDLTGTNSYKFISTDSLKKTHFLFRKPTITSFIPTINPYIGYGASYIKVGDKIYFYGGTRSSQIRQMCIYSIPDKTFSNGPAGGQNMTSFSNRYVVNIGNEIWFFPDSTTAYIYNITTASFSTKTLPTDNRGGTTTYAQTGYIFHNGFIYAIRIDVGSSSAFRLNVATNTWDLTYSATISTPGLLFYEAALCKTDDCIYVVGGTSFSHVKFDFASGSFTRLKNSPCPTNYTTRSFCDGRFCYYYNVTPHSDFIGTGNSLIYDTFNDHWFTIPGHQPDPGYTHCNAIMYDDKSAIQAFGQSEYTNMFLIENLFYAYDTFVPKNLSVDYNDNVTTLYGINQDGKNLIYQINPVGDSYILSLMNDFYNNDNPAIGLNSFTVNKNDIFLFDTDDNKIYSKLSSNPTANVVTNLQKTYKNQRCFTVGNSTYCFGGSDINNTPFISIRKLNYGLNFGISMTNDNLVTAPTMTLSTTLGSTFPTLASVTGLFDMSWVYLNNINYYFFQSSNHVNGYNFASYNADKVLSYLTLPTATDYTNCRIFECDGSLYFSSPTQIQKYNITTNTWEVIITLPDPLKDCIWTHKDGFLYGQKTLTNPSQNMLLHKYKLSDGTYEIINSGITVNTYVYAWQLVVTSKQIHMIGCFRTSPNVNLYGHFHYNIEENTFMHSTDTESWILKGGIFVVDDDVYYTGRYVSGNSWNDIWISRYDTLKNQWVSVKCYANTSAWGMVNVRHGGEYFSFCNRHDGTSARAVTFKKTGLPPMENGFNLVFNKESGSIAIKPDRTVDNPTISIYTMYQYLKNKNTFIPATISYISQQNDTGVVFTDKVFSTTKTDAMVFIGGRQSPGGVLINNNGYLLLNTAPSYGAGAACPIVTGKTVPFIIKRDASSYHLYVFFGLTGTTETLNDSAARFQIGTSNGGYTLNTWLNLVNHYFKKPAPRINHTIVQNDSSTIAYLYGGTNNETRLNDFWKFMHENWIRLRSPEYVFIDPACVLIGNFILFIDQDPATTSDPRYGVYDILLDKWSYGNIGFDLDVFNKIVPCENSFKSIVKTIMPLDPIEQQPSSNFNTMSQLKKLFALTNNGFENKKLLLFFKTSNSNLTPTLDKLIFNIKGTGVVKPSNIFDVFNVEYLSTTQTRLQKKTTGSTDVIKIVVTV